MIVPATQLWRLQLDVQTSRINGLSEKLPARHGELFRFLSGSVRLQFVECQMRRLLSSGRQGYGFISLLCHHEAHSLNKNAVVRNIILLRLGSWYLIVCKAIYNLRKGMPSSSFRLENVTEKENLRKTT